MVSYLDWLYPCYCVRMSLIAPAYHLLGSHLIGTLVSNQSYVYSCNWVFLLSFYAFLFWYLTRYCCCVITVGFFFFSSLFALMSVVWLLWILNNLILDIAKILVSVGCLNFKLHLNLIALPYYSNGFKYHDCLKDLAPSSNCSFLKIVKICSL